MNRPKINEIIVVEGRDDVSAVKKAVDAQVIKTNGYSLDRIARDLIKNAAEKKRIIVFTDSDYAGEVIRKRVEKIAGTGNVAHAFLPREQSTKDGDIGVENASPEDILHALERARFTRKEEKDLFTVSEMVKEGLQGTENSLKKRLFVGKYLGIGYCNAKQFLQRLNHFDISKSEFEEALDKYEDEVNGGRA